MTDNPRSPWQQLTYTCDDWRAAENTAVAVLGPLLTTAQDKGDIASWWFIRKGPELRVRLESPAGSGVIRYTRNAFMSCRQRG